MQNGYNCTNSCYCFWEKNKRKVNFHTSCQSWIQGSIAMICLLIAFEKVQHSIEEVNLKRNVSFSFYKGYWAIKAGQSWLFGMNTQCIITKSCMPGSVKIKPKATENYSSMLFWDNCLVQWKSFFTSEKNFGLLYFSID